MEEEARQTKRRRPFLYGVGLSGLVLVASLAYSQRSLDAYVQASARTIEWENRLDQFLTVRGHVNSLVQSIAAPGPDFESATAVIDRKTWNLQTTWSEFREIPHSEAVESEISIATIDVGIDRMAQAALRASGGLKHRNQENVLAETESVMRLDGELSAILGRAQGYILRAAEGAQADKLSALTAVNLSRSISIGAFFVLVSLALTMLILMGLGVAREWLGRGDGIPRRDDIAAA